MPPAVESATGKKHESMPSATFEPGPMPNRMIMIGKKMALRRAAVAGLGIALVPRYSVAADIAEGALVPLLPRYRVAARPLLAVWPRAAVVPQKVRVFVDFLRDWLAARDINGKGWRQGRSSRGSALTCGQICPIFRLGEGSPNSILTRIIVLRGFLP